MTADDPFLHFDAAYVLGALSSAEAAAFTDHLAVCPDCRRRVDEVAAAPAWLAGLPETAYALSAMEAADDQPAIETASTNQPTNPPETLLPALLHAVRTERRRQRLIGTAWTLAAACVAAVIVGFWPSSHAGATHPATPVAMTALVTASGGTAPVTATAALVDRPWGTEVDLVCRYSTAVRYNEPYSLVVVDAAGHSHDGGSWLLKPGATMRFTGGTSVPLAQVARVQITFDGTPILQLTR